MLQMSEADQLLVLEGTSYQAKGQRSKVGLMQPSRLVLVEDEDQACVYTFIYIKWWKKQQQKKPKKH